MNFDHEFKANVAEAVLQYMEYLPQNSEGRLSPTESEVGMVLWHSLTDLDGEQVYIDLPKI